MKIMGLLKRFLRDKSAVAIVEFAMILPVLLVMTVGSFEVARYAFLTQKLDRISATLADLTARAEALTAAEVDNLFNSIEHLAQPFSFDEEGMVVISSVVGRAGLDPLIIGQKIQGEIPDHDSKIGTNGETATLPGVFTDEDGQTLKDGEGLIVTEVFYSFAPYFTGGDTGILSDVLGTTTLYRQSFFRPRLSEKTTFD